MTIKSLQSTKNPLVKHVVQLTQKSKARRTHNACVVEGKREIIRAIQQGYHFTHLFFYEDSPEFNLLFEQVSSLYTLDSYVQKSDTHDYLPPLYLKCNEAIFQKIAYRGAHAHIIGIAKQRSWHLSEVTHICETSLQTGSILLLNGVEKPGNLGAIIRTVNALNIQAVLLCESQVDSYHPNVIRNSLGAIFSVPVVHCSSTEAITYLKDHKFSIYVTHMQGQNEPYTLDLKQKHCIVMGAEDQGVSQVWKEIADRLLCIPMHGVVDSLNVSVAASMMMYEVYRQRSLSSHPMSLKH